MSTMPLAVDSGFVDPFDKLRAFFSVSKVVETALRYNTVNALKHLFDSLQSTVTFAVQCQDAHEFIRRRDKSIVNYAKIVHAISLIADAEVDEEGFALLACDSLTHLHDEFVSWDIAHFGSEATEQVSFCIFTLKRIVKALPRLITSPVSGSEKGTDRQLSIQFVGYMLTCHFHLDCLRTVLRNKLEVSPPVLELIFEGMGSCAMAYATLREGLELRRSSVLALEESAVWDDEDQALLDESERSGTSLT